VSTWKGFGKNRPTKKKSTKPFVAVGPPDPTINDPTKPEFDDQGYTLYTDGTTGKKSRVFEALVNYPCEFTMKIVGMNEGSFVTDIVAVVAEACLEEPSSISYTTKAMGKWTSVTVQAPVKNSGKIDFYREDWSLFCIGVRRSVCFEFLGVMDTGRRSFSFHSSLSPFFGVLPRI